MSTITNHLKTKGQRMTRQLHKIIFTYVFFILKPLLENKLHESAEKLRCSIAPLQEFYTLYVQTWKGLNFVRGNTKKRILYIFENIQLDSVPFLQTLFFTTELKLSI